MPYVYTMDPPSSDPQYNKRMGFRTPRSIVLPPYLLTNQYFVDYVDSIDIVFGPEVDEKTDILGNLRNMWVTNPEQEASIQDMEMQDFEAWSRPEREILVKQVNMLGMKLMNAGVVTDISYHTIARFLGQYWFEKGTEDFINFINFCLNSDLQVANLWTEDYKNFVAYGSTLIGVPIWEGGTWYPTTHVIIEAQGGLDGIDLNTLVAFFYDIANYNLVLYSVDSIFDMSIVDDLDETEGTATIVAMAMWCVNQVTISNVYRFGVSYPPIHENVGTPTSVLTTAPADTNYAAQYVLGSPTGWIEYTPGNIVPVYHGPNRNPSPGSDVPTTLMGGASTTGDLSGFTMLYGPVGWTPVPGAAHTDTHIPVFSSVPVARTVATSDLTTNIIGNQRANLLVNPRGFMDIGGGQFIPYW